MTYFYMGDIPAAALIVSPSLNGEPITLQPLDDVVVLMTDPSGDEITTLTATVDEQEIEVTSLSPPSSRRQGSTRSPSSSITHRTQEA